MKATTGVRDYVNTSDSAVHVNGIDMYIERRGEGTHYYYFTAVALAANWRLIFNAPPRGYELIVPDLRGHGSSTNPSQVLTFGQLASDVVELLDALASARSRRLV